VPQKILHSLNISREKIFAFSRFLGLTAKILALKYLDFCKNFITTSLSLENITPQNI